MLITVNWTTANTLQNEFTANERTTVLRRAANKRTHQQMGCRCMSIPSDIVCAHRNIREDHCCNNNNKTDKRTGHINELRARTDTATHTRTIDVEKKHNRQCAWLFGILHSPGRLWLKYDSIVASTFVQPRTSQLLKATQAQVAV